MSDHVPGNPEQRQWAAANLDTAGRVVDELTAELFKHRLDCRDMLCMPVEYGNMITELDLDQARMVLHKAIERLV